ncbi:Triosephosphate isomerase [Candidatus Tiddalikarchaeum anstoanum]|nr:Triosephosphate isomerase [Candidatus Tiddalikarchaeum anstoanum]
MKPLIIVNFKCYDKATGHNGLKIAAYCSTYDNVIVCPQAIDLDNISAIPGLNVFSQHVDPVLEGPFTGKMGINVLKKAGVKGSLLNHSENRLKFETIAETVSLLKKNGLKSLICCESLDEAAKFAKLRPDYICFEPKSLIGKTQSVADLNPELITTISKAVKPVKLIIGAGIDSPKEVREVLLRGAVGVIVASSVIKSDDPRKIIKELANA